MPRKKRTTTKKKSASKKPAPPQYDMMPELTDIADHFPGKFAESTPQIWGIINTLCKDAKVYLEVGSWAGATAAAAKHKNKHLRALAIDNLSRQEDKGKTGHIEKLKYMAKYYAFELVVEDYKEALPRLTEEGLEVDVYLYDGPHTEVDQYEGLALADPMLNKDGTIIVDDANWEVTKKGTEKFCEEYNWEVVFERLTPANGSPDYWNGIQILKRK